MRRFKIWVSFCIVIRFDFFGLFIIFLFLLLLLQLFLFPNYLIELISLFLVFRNLLVFRNWGTRRLFIRRSQLLIDKLHFLSRSIYPGWSLIIRRLQWVHSIIIIFIGLLIFSDFILILRFRFLVLALVRVRVLIFIKIRIQWFFGEYFDWLRPRARGLIPSLRCQWLGSFMILNLSVLFVIFSEKLVERVAKILLFWDEGLLWLVFNFLLDFVLLDKFGLIDQIVNDFFLFFLGKSFLTSLFVDSFLHSPRFCFFFKVKLRFNKAGISPFHS